KMSCVKIRQNYAHRKGEKKACKIWGDIHNRLSGQLVDVKNRVYRVEGRPTIEPYEERFNGAFVSIKHCILNNENEDWSVIFKYAENLLGQIKQNLKAPGNKVTEATQRVENAKLNADEALLNSLEKYGDFAMLRKASSQLLDCKEDLNHLKKNLKAQNKTGEYPEKHLLAISFLLSLKALYPYDLLYAVFNDLEIQKIRKKFGVDGIDENSLIKIRDMSKSFPAVRLNQFLALSCCSLEDGHEQALKSINQIERELLKVLDYQIYLPHSFCGGANMPMWF
ncbi:MAG: hypothetical protein KAR79_05795, partial [Simkaniaceae bacterium]|nr:hypothetical protein [Simkaniaceae bacterium]